MWILVSRSVSVCGGGGGGPGTSILQIIEGRLYFKNLQKSSIYFSFTKQTASWIRKIWWGEFSLNRDIFQIVNEGMIKIWVTIFRNSQWSIGFRQCLLLAAVITESCKAVHISLSEEHTTLCEVIFSINSEFNYK